MANDTDNNNPQPLPAEELAAMVAKNSLHWSETEVYALITTIRKLQRECAQAEGQIAERDEALARFREAAVAATKYDRAIRLTAYDQAQEWDGVSEVRVASDDLDALYLDWLSKTYACLQERPAPDGLLSELIAETEAEVARVRGKEEEVSDGR